MKKVIFLIITTLSILVIGFFGSLTLLKRYVNPEEQACTLEAKLCPDGSTVGRRGPNCEFASCPTPTPIDISNWKTMNDEGLGMSFFYPENLSTEYIEAFDWPPKVQVLKSSYSCTEGGTEEVRAGRTERRMINNREYCITEEVGAAAGSKYTQYAYAFPKDGKTAVLNFTIRSPECANYADEGEIKACEEEREAFEIDSTIDRIAQTLSLE